MSIRKDFHRFVAAAVWSLSATIATPLLPEGRSAAEPRPRLFAQNPPAATFASRSDLVVLHVVVKDRRGVSVSVRTRNGYCMDAG